MYYGPHFVYTYNSDKRGYLFLNSYKIRSNKLVLGTGLLETDTLTAGRKDSWLLGRKNDRRRGREKLPGAFNLAIKNPIEISVVI